ncbi:lipopolysaccharide-induced tumor necrosis factor-alpha factor homolog [Morone saxatilis]|uniref:lipopolysaccharide-induced tumor necrosis factor-alpha factor homolog n=1 Tax=Morone saxatilis TaxID=34816 RepID=UPI0015E228EC|nr:lipopolysaccharide-induced tumor necrosis factor-alpha factor homolog [Morone saxatilis]
MEPPSYEESRLHPPALSAQVFNIPPPPSYDASLSPPSTPPPTYGEAITNQPDPFPVLTPPRVPPAGHSQSTGLIIHPPIQVGVTPSVSSRQTQPVVVTQPQPVPITVTCLREAPGLVHCPHCHHVVTTKVTYHPGRAAWCMCCLLTVMGLICGCCLIPFMVHSLQDAHHSCPQCGKQLHTYTR